jgi:hypothetical protein
MVQRGTHQRGAENFSIIFEDDSGSGAYIALADGAYNPSPLIL